MATASKARGGRPTRRRVLKEPSPIVAAKPVPHVTTSPASVPTAMAEQMLTFHAGGYEYGISILHIREIVEYRELTPVPGTPSWIRGVVNLRGTVVPVIDLAAKLGLPETQVTRRSCLLIIEVAVATGPAVVAIMVDGVRRVVELSPDELQDVPLFGPRLDVRFLIGMARVQERLVLLLDITRIIESADVLSGAALINALEDNTELVPAGPNA